MVVIGESLLDPAGEKYFSTALVRFPERSARQRSQRVADPRLVGLELERSVEERPDPVGPVEACLDDRRDVQRLEMAGAFERLDDVVRFPAAILPGEEKRVAPRVGLALRIGGVRRAQQDDAVAAALLELRRPALDGRLGGRLPRLERLEEPARGFLEMSAVALERRDVEERRVVGGVELQRLLPRRPRSGVVVE